MWFLGMALRQLSNETTFREKTSKTITETSINTESRTETTHTEVQVWDSERCPEWRLAPTGRASRHLSELLAGEQICLPRSQPVCNPTLGTELGGRSWASTGTQRHLVPGPGKHQVSAPALLVCCMQTLNDLTSLPGDAAGQSSPGQPV